MIQWFSLESPRPMPRPDTITDPTPGPPATGGGEDRFVADLTAEQAALHGFIGSLMPGDPAVDDVLQRTNLTLWHKRGDFTPGTNFRAWAFAVAKWTVRSHFKDLGRKHWLVFDDELAEAVSERMAEKIPPSPNSRQVALRECMAQLRPIDRDLLLSHYEIGESLSECAARIGRSPRGLKVTLFRLRAALRRCIQSKLEIDRAKSFQS